MTLPEILTKAASFVAIIAFGYVLRQSGFFKEKDFYFLTKIVLKITLPAAIVYNFSSMEIDVSNAFLFADFLALTSQATAI